MSPDPDSRRDLVGAAGLALAAAGYLLANCHHPLDTLATPGPGAFPLAVGLFTLILAAGQALLAVRPRRDRRGPLAGAPRGPGGVVVIDGESARRWPVAMVATLVGYACAIALVGFLAASFALVLVSSHLLGERGWLRPALLALGVTAVAYGLFVVWLGVPLPRGPLR